jgi:hypothetical protein
MAVELIATTPPSTIAGAGRTPASHANVHATAPTARSCSAPSPKTSRRIASMRGQENSSPSVNSRKTTPISASARVAGASSSSPKADGPSSMPTAR